MKSPQARIIPRNEHSISRKLISPSALKVMYRLEQAGFKAYLVGGSIRDILLGIQPKDFDIATNAHPEQVHKLFSNSRLIGRRFKLVHVLFGREVIEVATFRASSDKEESPSQRQTADGMLTRDNVYGTIEEDALRRDFTANALYYSATDFNIYDYTNAIEDIEDKQLRLIGDPEERYREDPVRMLRALRFAEKLGFSIESNAEHAISDFAQLMQSVASARLFDEVIKLFVSGCGLNIYFRLKQHTLFEAMFPAVANSLANHDSKGTYDRFIQAGLLNTDKRIKEDKPITPAFLYAVLLWPEVHRLWIQKQSEGLPEFPAMQQAAQTAIESQLSSIMIPKRFLLNMKEIWEMQIRLTKNHGNRGLQIVQLPRFRAGYDFLLLRESAGEIIPGLGDWWTKFQITNPPPEHKRRTERPKSRPSRRKRPPNSQRNSN